MMVGIPRNVEVQSVLFGNATDSEMAETECFCHFQADGMPPKYHDMSSLPWSMRVIARFQQSSLSWSNDDDRAEEIVFLGSVLSLLPDEGAC